MVDWAEAGDRGGEPGAGCEPTEVARKHAISSGLLYSHLIFGFTRKLAFGVAQRVAEGGRWRCCQFKQNPHLTPAAAPATCRSRHAAPSLRWRAEQETSGKESPAAGDGNRGLGKGREVNAGQMSRRHGGPFSSRAEQRAAVTRSRPQGSPACLIRAFAEIGL